MDILRFVTAGNVDDGKSSLIGRLLYDSGVLTNDTLEAIRQSSKGLINGQLNLALLTDGLRAEREQGITIDVSYKFFATGKRKFIIADSPGHVQYTRNMITACSTADLAIILIDARNGVTEQTRRHNYIVSMMGVKHIIFAINKMDLIDYSEQQFLKIRSDILEFPFLNDDSVKTKNFVPVNSLTGCNIVNPSQQTPWYSGVTLFSILENLELNSDINQNISRFPIQFVIRPQSTQYPDFRGYAGQLSTGQFFTGQKVQIFPSEMISKIKELYIDGKLVEKINHTRPAIVLLEDEIDIARGYVLTGKTPLTKSSDTITTHICWMDESPLKIARKIILQHNNRRITAKVLSIKSKKNMQNLSDIKANELKMNDIATIQLLLHEKIYYDSYTEDKKTGSFILVDPFNKKTLAAGILKT